ncbi:MAG: 2-isopropylmalate synthase [Clostridiales bacterium]|nr:MAG: 2-isopropylmalate synthase [Clostridiales bacterium]
MAKRISIFDTTLRDGEQAPGFSMDLGEKLQVARQLERLGVDVMEAGFARASQGDFEAVKAIAGTVKNAKVASLARTATKDIDAAWDAVKGAESPRIHTFIATSEIHMKYKLKMKPADVIEKAEAMVRYAAARCPDIEFSAEDATRSNPIFLAKIFDRVINAGATVINVPDTVGYAMPDEFFEFIETIRKNMKFDHRAQWSVHCHNDLGLAVANTLAAAKAGVTQFECTVNGIGERAGNAALEEIIMAASVKKSILDISTNIDSRQIARTSRLISDITGVSVQPNKAVVGKNAFAHESGIHQHGMLSNSLTYEIMTPESVGFKKTKLVLGKHSGKHAFRDRLSDMGIEMDDAEMEKVFVSFKALADKKKTVEKEDIEALVNRHRFRHDERFSLKGFTVQRGFERFSKAEVTIENASGINKELGEGDGPVDAAFNAIEKMTGIRATLKSFSVTAVTEGKDAQGRADIVVEAGGKRYRGRGLSTDIVEASILSYVDAINKIDSQDKKMMKEA